MAGLGAFLYTNATADAVITANASALLYSLIVTSAAATATIQLFDDTTTTNPANPITGLITAPAGGFTTPFTIVFRCQVKHGIVVKIGVAAATVTVTYR